MPIANPEKLLGWNLVKVQTTRSCTPIPDVSFKTKEESDSSIISILTQYSKEDVKIKQTSEWKAEAVHLYKVQKQLDFGSIKFRIGTQTFVTDLYGEAAVYPTNLTRVPIPFEEFLN